MLPPSVELADSVSKKDSSCSLAQINLTWAEITHHGFRYGRNVGKHAPGQVHECVFWVLALESEPVDLRW